ncbi:MAG: hypothetical protein Rubg2KO_09870 [Rubricoccaceae bacterium]
MWALLVIGVAGCGLLRPGPEVLIGQPSSARIERVGEELFDAITPADRRLAISETLATHGLTPLAGGAAPFDARRYALGLDTTWLGGFIPGRHPVLRSELVVARVGLEDSSAVILLEAARVLVERSKTKNVPGRSLLVVLSPDASRGVARSLWPAASVHARLDLTYDSADGVAYTVAWPERETEAVYASEADEGALERVNQLLGLLLHLASPLDTLGSEHQIQPQRELE